MHNHHTVTVHYLKKVRYSLIRVDGLTVNLLFVIVCKNCKVLFVLMKT